MMNKPKTQILDLVLYDHSRGKTQFDYENDYNDPLHWYNGNNFKSTFATGDIIRDQPSDASTILDYIKKLSNDEIKDQDHYLILGLDHLRYRATEAQIKSAYRKACLLFHPDRHHNKYELPHSQFVHLTRAYEVLCDSQKRLSYDSIDDEVDDTIPSENDSGNFYEVFGRALYRNARWSIEQPVPLLGNEYTSYEHAQKFYTFWKNFRSKREFSHLDEQPVESGDCREERRYVARLNKKQREERKKNETKRIRQLIDNCRSCDPRIPRYVQIKAEKTRLEKEEKKKRQQLKKAAKNGGFKVEAPQKVTSVPVQAKNSVVTPVVDNEKKIQERERKKQLKKHLDEQRHKLRQHVEKHNYFTKMNGCSDKKLNNIEQFDKFIKIIKLPDIEELNHQLEKLGLDFDACSNKYTNKLNCYYGNVNGTANTPASTLPSESKASSAIDADTTQQPVIKESKSTTTENENENENTWTKERVVVLLKAMKIYQAGTKSRYEIVTEYINNHTGCNFSVKQIIQQAKTLTVNQDTNVVKMVAETKNKPPQPQTVAPTKIAAKEQTKNQPSESVVAECEWSAEEQKLFQQALKSIPIGTNERWNKISTLIPTKTPIQCQQRLKYLCDVIKKKKKKQ